MSAADDGVIEVHGERFRASAHWDDHDPQNTGWYIEYQTEAGDCVDDSQKIWHPPIDQLGPDDGDAIREIAASYLLKLEGSGPRVVAAPTTATITRWQVESLDSYGHWTPESNGTYDSEADALAAVESVIATCGWDRDRLRAVEVSE